MKYKIYLVLSVFLSNQTGKGSGEGKGVTNQYVGRVHYFALFWVWLMLADTLSNIYWEWEGLVSLWGLVWNVLSNQVGWWLLSKKKKKSWLVAGVCVSGPSILRVVELVKHLGFWALTVWVQAIQSWSWALLKDFFLFLFLFFINYV